jgi:hypothetical protein
VLRAVGSAERADPGDVVAGEHEIEVQVL